MDNEAVSAFKAEVHCTSSCDESAYDTGIYSCMHLSLLLIEQLMTVKMIEKRNRSITSQILVVYFLYLTIESFIIRYR